MKRRFEHRTAMLRANIAIVGSVMAFGATAQDRAEIDRAQIIGNRELPKVLYIVPWKKPLPGDLSSRPLTACSTRRWRRSIGTCSAGRCATTR